jgi:hypothetical protein
MDELLIPLAQKQKKHQSFVQFQYQQQSFVISSQDRELSEH